MKLYMAVTTDVYELPLCVEETVEDLAKHFNLARQTVYSAISTKKMFPRKGYQFIRIEVDE